MTSTPPHNKTLFQAKCLQITSTTISHVKLDMVLRVTEEEPLDITRPLDNAFYEKSFKNIMNCAHAIHGLSPVSATIGSETKNVTFSIFHEAQLVVGAIANVSHFCGPKKEENLFANKILVPARSGVLFAGATAKCFGSMYIAMIDDNGIARDIDYKLINLSSAITSDLKKAFSGGSMMKITPEGTFEVVHVPNESCTYKGDKFFPNDEAASHVIYKIDPQGWVGDKLRNELNLEELSIEGYPLGKRTVSCFSISCRTNPALEKPVNKFATNYISMVQTAYNTAFYKNSGEEYVPEKTEYYNRCGDFYMILNESAGLMTELDEAFIRSLVADKVEPPKDNQSETPAETIAEIDEIVQISNEVSNVVPDETA